MGRTEVREKEEKDELDNMYWQGFGAGYSQAVRDFEESCLPLMRKNKLRHQL